MEKPIGQIIREEVERQGLTIDEFAKRISTSRTNAYSIFNRLSIDMELLARISMVLHRNFFADMAQHMNTQLKSAPEESIMANAKLESLIHPLEKEVDGKLYSEAAFTKEREELKALLKEYFECDHRIPLLILEAGYTFGAREVVKRVANEVFHGVGSAPCPKLLDVSRVKSMPAKVLIDYIDCNTFDSVEASDERLNEICRAQSDVNKKFVCIIHTNPIVSMSKTGGVKSFDDWGSEMSIFLSRNEQFFITVYRWGRRSLLSWATEAGLHEYVLNYIRKHQVPEGIRKDYLLTNAYVSFFGLIVGLPLLHRCIDYPTAEAYSQSEWQNVSDFITNQGDISQELHLRNFIQDIIDFNEMDASEYLATRKPQMRSIECHVEVEGYLVECMNLCLTEAEAGALFYLYELALAKDLKGLNEEAVEDQFFPWLEQHHPKMAKAMIRAAEVELADRLDQDFDGMYRNNIPCIAPNSIEEGWCVEPDLKYHFFMYDMPKWK